MGWVFEELRHTDIDYVRSLTVFLIISWGFLGKLHDLLLLLMSD
jgi:hypothetical protein